MDSESPLKYHSLNGAFGDYLARYTDNNEISITCCSIGEGVLCIGTSDGSIVYSDIEGKNICSRKIFANESVKDISLDSTADVLAACTEGGAVAYLKIRGKIDKSNKDKDVRGKVIFKDAPLIKDVFNSSLTSICVEEGFVEKKKERTYVVGTAGGAIIQYRPASSWYKKKIIVLFDGAHTPVDALSWKGKIIAWSDSRHVRLMCVSNQTALCFINAPSGLPMDSAASSSFCPCSLYWESNSRLLVGWGDTFKQVDLYHSNGGVIENDNSRDVYGSVSSNNSSAGNRSFDGTSAGSIAKRRGGDEKETGLVDVTAKITAEWQCGFIICRVTVLDTEHVGVVGFQPPDDEILSRFYDSSTSPTDYPLYPNVCIMKRSNGNIVSMDTVPLVGCNMENFRSPHDFKLVSSYRCHGRRNDYLNWNLTTSANRRGSTRGMSPVLYLVSGGEASGIVVVRLKDTIDRIAGALAKKDLSSALDYASADRAALTAPSCPSGMFESLLSIYMEDLLEASVCPAALEAAAAADKVHPAVFAATECVRLIGQDVAQWEHFIERFTQFGHLSLFVKYIPIEKLVHPMYKVDGTTPRLRLEVIESIIYNLLESDAETFLYVVKKWGSVHKPIPLFNRELLLEKLEVFHKKGKDQGDGGARRLDSFVLEAMAMLYTYLEKFTKAIECYLYIPDLSVPPAVVNTFVLPVDSGEEDPAVPISFSSAAVGRKEGKREFILAFELIEKKALFRAVEDHVLCLLLLNKEQTMKLLLKYLDKFPVSSVLAQLQEYRLIQLWYLHSFFVSNPELFNSVEYSEYHILLVSLYCEFAPPCSNDTQSNTIPPPPSVRKLTNKDDSISSDVDDRLSKKHGYNSPLMVFLKTSSFLPIDVALRECQQAIPSPLYPEIIYIYCRMGNKKLALELLLTKIGDVKMVIEFVEAQDISLWDDVITYAVRNVKFLSVLLDYIGECTSINPSALISKIIPGHTHIPYLRERLENLISSHHFQTLLNEKCGDILYHDTIHLMKQLNQNQRKAIKVDPGLRCCLCGKNLANIPEYDSCAIIATNDVVNQIKKGLHTLSNTTPSLKSATSTMDALWSSGIAAKHDPNTGIAVFASGRGSSFHRLCYNKLMETN